MKPQGQKAYLSTYQVDTTLHSKDHFGAHSSMLVTSGGPVPQQYNLYHTAAMGSWAADHIDEVKLS